MTLTNSDTRILIDERSPCPNGEQAPQIPMRALCPGIIEMLEQISTPTLRPVDCCIFGRSLKLAQA